jgi:hypothetical protein
MGGFKIKLSSGRINQCLASTIINKEEDMRGIVFGHSVPGDATRTRRTFIALDQVFVENARRVA